MAEAALKGIRNRILQFIARNSPGALGFRPRLNRWRGVKIGRKVWIGYDAIIETSYPHMVTIKDGATVGIRTLIIAHFRGLGKGVVIEEEAFLGPGAIILPDVVIGRGAVVAAGSVVSTSVPPFTLVQGNPAKAIARVGTPPNMDVSYQEFVRSLRPLRQKANRQDAKDAKDLGRSIRDSKFEIRD